MGKRDKLKLCFGYVKAILIKINYANCFIFMLITTQHNKDHIIFVRLTLLVI